MSVDCVKGMLAVIVGYTINIVGGITVALNTMLILILIDYITGMIKGYIKSELSAKKGFEGILKKICYILFVIVGHYGDEILGTSSIRSIVISWVCVVEFISVIENSYIIGLPIPKRLIDGLLVWKGKVGDRLINTLLSVLNTSSSIKTDSEDMEYKDDLKGSNIDKEILDEIKALTVEKNKHKKE